MHNCGSIWLISKDIKNNCIQPLYKFKKPSFEEFDIILPIVHDEKIMKFVLQKDTEEENETYLNNKIVENFPVILSNGDIITYKNHDFRLSLYDTEEKISFDSFWYENLYLGNLPVFSARAFEKLIEVEIYKAKRYQYPFSLVLLRFDKNINQKNKEIEKIICENIRFTDMLSHYSDYEYLLYLYQVKEENTQKIIEKLTKLIYEMLDLKVDYAKGVDYNPDFSNFIEFMINLYCK